MQRHAPGWTALLIGLVGAYGTGCASSVVAFGAADAAVPDAAMTLSGAFDFEPPLRYFHNRDVDARVASGPVVPNTDLPATLVAYLDRAALSIDVATYQFTDEAIADALVRAHQRGVRVRLVMDADNVTTPRTGSRALR